jgi:hypothetical protein
LRNYYRFYFTRVIGVNTTTQATFTQYYVGENQARASSAAAFGVIQFNAQGYDQTSVADLGPFNFLMNKGILMTYFNQDPTHSGNSLNWLGWWMFPTLLDACANEGIDPQISPKEQDVRPWNGKKPPRGHA